MEKSMIEVVWPRVTVRQVEFYELSKGQFFYWSDRPRVLFMKTSGSHATCLEDPSVPSTFVDKGRLAVPVRVEIYVGQESPA